LRTEALQFLIPVQNPANPDIPFRAETGQSPAKAVENQRVEAVRLMMEQSRHPIDIIARQTGFADRDRMRRAFLRAFGQPPQAIRRNARGEEAAA
jgi:transcriptional regulator GlxA family with amidase domain